jgi:hypothetical protein
MNIKGGNQSGIFGARNTFAISAVSPLTFNAGNSTYSFSAAVNPAGDINITSCWNAAGTDLGAAASIGNCIYTAWTLLLPGFGVVPFTMTSWNGTTNVGTFQMLANYAAYQFPNSLGGSNATTYTDISNEVQAATSIYAAQRLIVYQGQSGSVRDVHVENNGACTTLFQSAAGFGGDSGMLLERIRINGGQADFFTASFYCQEGFPFVDTISGNAPTILENNQLGQGGVNWVFDVSADLTVIGTQGELRNPITRTTFVDSSGHGDNLLNAAGATRYSRAQGSGEWELCPWAAANDRSNRNNLSSGPCLGYRPSPWTHPRLTDADFSYILASPITAPLGTYIPIDGSTIYSNLDAINVAGNPNQAKLYQSSHAFFSYGQNLTTTNIPGLSIKWIGGGTAVMADSGTLGYMFPGLAVYLNAGSGDVRHVVTGVYPSISLDGGTHPGYFTVFKASGYNGPYPLTGTVGTTYTATQIDQELYNWGAVNTFVSIGSPTLSTCGASPTIGANSTNRSGTFTTGSSGTPTGCTVTFANAYPTSAFCSISPANTAANGVSGGTYISAQGASAFTVTLGTGTNSAKYNYTCQGN